MQYKSSFSTVSIPVTTWPGRILAALSLAAIALIAPGCSDQNEATNKLVQQQQEQLEHQQQELEQLQANQNQGYAPGVATSSRGGGCDKQVETVASQRGGEKFAAGDFNKALGYYQDALMACANDDKAEVNVARTYEALGNKVAAINLYRKVADTGDANSATVSDAQEEAKASLLRLQAARMP
jgi:tetratricopeptide (TPR) repeat protein